MQCSICGEKFRLHDDYRDHLPSCEERTFWARVFRACSVCGDSLCDLSCETYKELREAQVRLALLPMLLKYTRICDRHIGHDNQCARNTDVFDENDECNCGFAELCEALGLMEKGRWKDANA